MRISIHSKGRASLFRSVSKPSGKWSCESVRRFEPRNASAALRKITGRGQCFRQVESDERLVALGLILAFSGMLLATHKYVTTRWNPLTLFRKSLNLR